MPKRFVLQFLAIGVFGTATALAAKPDTAAIKFFEQEVRPVLAENCYKCHGPDKQKAGLRLDSLSGMMTGGPSGAVIEPGDAEASLLIQAVSHTLPDLKMPFKGDKLTDQQIASLTRWIDNGAVWPGAKPTRKGDQFTAGDRDWWAIQPVRDPAPPVVENDDWVRNPIDRFVLRKLNEHKLAPAHEADRVALIRRLSFDLTGLPPTPEQIEAFVKDDSADAYEKLVDRLLDDPAYGERQARLWLDLVRYADSDGYRADGFRPKIWRYRDYVVDAFNEDKPYNEFVREQIAGDEIKPGDPEARVATGYLRLGVYEWNQRDSYMQQNIMINDITAVTGDVFMGLSMACAECHNHKFDPILQKDYYRLRAFFEPVLWRDDLTLATSEEHKAYKQQRKKWEDAAGELYDELEELRAKYLKKAEADALSYFIDDLKAVYHKPEAERTPYEDQLAYLVGRQVEQRYEKRGWSDEDKKRREEIEKKLKELDVEKPSRKPELMVATDVGAEAPPTTIPGDRTKRNIKPGVISILDPKPIDVEKPDGLESTGRRTALANWLASPDNPLTARVMVNRIWQQHFGRGLVATPSEFGNLGDPPSHPELLDWLATRFVESNWSVKAVHRLIANSAAYRQTADRVPGERIAKIDPQNKWLWRMDTRRLDAEQVRDAMLAVSGQLRDEVGGSTVGGGTPRRSVYVRRKRLSPDPLLDAFDAADGLSSTATRNVTTTATQALLMINGSWPLDRAKALANRIRKEHPGQLEQQIEYAYRLAYGRIPDTAERDRAVQFIKDQADLIADREAAPPTFGVKPFPGRKTQAIHVRDGSEKDQFHVPDNDTLPSGDFTIEAIVKLDSMYDDASVRVIASQWGGDNSYRGWAFGVTSKKSAYTPRNLIMQFVGDAEPEKKVYEVIPSGLHLEVGRPYYVAVSMDLDQPGEKGVTFYMKDLASEDAALQVAQVPHKVTSNYDPDTPLAIGGRFGRNHYGWDGLIDELRVTAAVLPRERLLLSQSELEPETVGYWRFESENVVKDSSTRGNDLIPGQKSFGVAGTAEAAAVVDFCHLLLNSNEFLYVE